MTFRSVQVFQVSCVYKKMTCYGYTRKIFFNLLCMLLKDWIKELGPCSINRSLESTNEIIKVVDNIQQDHEVVVIVNLNHEVICINLI